MKVQPIENDSEYQTLVIAIISSIAGIIVITSIGLYLWMRCKKRKKRKIFNAIFDVESCSLNLEYVPRHDEDDVPKIKPGKTLNLNYVRG